MNHRYASEREATAAAKRLRPEQQHEWSSVSVFRKVWKRGSQRPAPLCSGSASQMLLATLWNTYICINEALALTLSDFSLVPPHPYRQLFTLTTFQ